MKKTELKFADHGPIPLTGEWTLLDSNGKILASNEDKPIALCRCGGSSKKPYCDGAHRTIGFKSVVGKP
mgnify:CR=1 FL=1